MQAWIRVGRLAALGALTVAMSGCAGISFASRGVPIGTVYVSAQTNEEVTQNAVTDPRKRGEACAASILGWIVTGDASVGAAMAKAGLTKVAVVDSNYTNLLGLYSTYCVVVLGE